jgi:hypothetical protein
MRTRMISRGLLHACLGLLACAGVAIAAPVGDENGQGLKEFEWTLKGFEWTLKSGPQTGDDFTWGHKSH